MILNGPGISYTEPDIGSEFVPPLPEHPREAIVKLCEHCTNRLLHRDELLGYEYWSFAEAATDEQAEVLCKMKMRRPYTLPEMVKLTGMPEADIEKMLDDMSYTGLLEYNWENPERAKQWVLPMLVPGSAEFLNMRVSQLEEHPVYAKFFEQASKGPLSRATPMVPPGGAGIGMHVIPVEKAIDAVRAVTQGRVICVFGCGGDRDHGKRPKMGAAALSADIAVVTSDNPRTEDPDAIIEQILVGMEGHEDRYVVMPDRSEAICYAIEAAGPGDVVLIAGKGHEDYQIVGTVKHHFDDREVAAHVLDEMRS